MLLSLSHSQSVASFVLTQIIDSGMKLKKPLARIVPSHYYFLTEAKGASRPSISFFAGIYRYQDEALRTFALSHPSASR